MRMAVHYQVFLICMVVLAAVTLSACSKSPTAPLRIASSPWPGYEPIYLARDVGYLSEAKNKIFELPSSDITLESFRNHSADMASLTLDETLNLLASGVQLRILFVMDSSNGADAVLAKPGVKSLADLKGQRIVIANIPLGVYMLSRTLNAANLIRADVQVIPSAENRHPEMYRQHKADVFITFDPFKSELTAMGAHTIFDSSQMPNEIFDLMVVHEDVFQARRQDVCQVAQQWFRTLDYIKQSPVDANRRIAKRLGISVHEYQKMMGGIAIPSREENMRLLGGASPAIVAPANNLVQVMLKEGQMKHHADVHLALDTDIEACLAR